MSGHSSPRRQAPRDSPQDEDAQRRNSPRVAKKLDTSAAITDLGKLALLQLASRQPGIAHSEETEAATLALGARAISQRRSASQTNQGILPSAGRIARHKAPRRTETQARSESDRQVNRGASPQSIARRAGHEPGTRAATPPTSTEAGPLIRRGSAQPTSFATPRSFVTCYPTS